MINAKGLKSLRFFLGGVKACGVTVGVFISDGIRFLRYSHLAKKCAGQRLLESKLWAQAHVIEKGMSLPDIRLGYGQSGINTLFSFMDDYLAQGLNCDARAYQNAIAVLHSYVGFHVQHDHDVSALEKRLAGYKKPCEQLGSGIVEYSKEKYRELAQGSFVDFSTSRHSVRSFGEGPVDEQLVRQALELARKSPSACNRQCWGVTWVRSQEKKEALLAIQNGSRGFGTTADSFLVISGDLNSSFGLGERRQVYVDCSLYAMCLMNALHYIGVGVCPLNWFVLPQQDKRLRAVLNLSGSHDIVLILAIGNLPKNVVVAKSVRKSVDETLRGIL